MENTAEERSNGRWTKLEHQQFLQGLQIQGKNWKKIEQMIGTRTGCQIRSHAQKFFLKMKTNPSEFPQQFLKFASELPSQEHGHQGSLVSVGEKQIQSLDHETDISYFCQQLSKFSRDLQGKSNVNSAAKQPSLWQVWIDTPHDKQTYQQKQELLKDKTTIQIIGCGQLCEVKNGRSFVPCSGKDDGMQRITKLRKLN